MSVSWCRERYGNEAERTADTGRYRRLFFVWVTDPANDREVTIINSPEVRHLLSGAWQAGADVDRTVKVNGFRILQIEDHPNLYELEIEYESVSGSDDGGGGGGPNSDPLLEPPEFEYTWASGKRISDFVFKASTKLFSSEFPEGQQINVREQGVLNSAKEPFDPQPEFDDDRLVLTITRNEASFNARLALLYGNSINSDPFSGANPGQLLMKPWRGRLQFKNGVTYWRKTYEIHFRIEGWRMKLLDHGSYYYPTGYQIGAAKIHFLDENGQPTTGLLDGTGNALAVGADPKHIALDPYHLTVFGAIGLPVPN